jgi:hypothetical protein
MGDKKKEPASIDQSKANVSAETEQKFQQMEQVKARMRAEITGAIEAAVLGGKIGLQLSNQHEAAPHVPHKPLSTPKAVKSKGADLPPA